MTVSGSTSTSATVSAAPIRLHAHGRVARAHELHQNLAHRAGVPKRRAAQWLNDIELILRREEVMS